MLEIALGCIARGWHVFPCRPRTKVPAIKGGFLNASNGEDQVREWWSRWPDANVGIATGASGLCVLDIDTGLAGDNDAQRFLRDNGIGSTYTVRTGRRPGFGLQVYFMGAGLQSTPWKDPHDPEIAGDIRCSTGYVMAAGSVHPSGEIYAEWDVAPVDFMPEYLRKVAAASRDVLKKAVDLSAPIAEWRNDTLYRRLCKLRADGMDDHMIRANAEAYNSNPAIMAEPLPEDELNRIVDNACAKPVGVPEPEIILGSNLKKTAEVVENKKTWEERFHSYSEMMDAPPLDFHIEGFLPVESITAIAAPVAQRKTLISLNIVHALLTGEALFGHFKVLAKPKRVIYLCPEMGIRAFTKRLRAIGLLEYVGKTLFVQTMSTSIGDQYKRLRELPDETLEGSVVFLDTLVRFIDGEEDNSSDMRLFGQEVMETTKRGVKCVILLAHSGKSTAEAGELTLQNIVRGSGELGAFLTSCWATRLQDPSNEYKSASYIRNVKQRDFESEPFEATCDENGRMTIVGTPGGVSLQSNQGFKANKDGKDDAALAFVEKHIGERHADIARALREHDIERSAEWVRRKKAELVEKTGGRLPAATRNLRSTQ